MEAGEVVSPDGIEPLGQPFALALGEHLAEGADVAGKGVQFRAVDQDGLELKALRLGEGLRPAKDPSGDDPRGQWPSRDGAWREPLLPEIGANPLVAALIAERHDLLPHSPGVRAALVPAVIQIGFEGVEFGWPALPLPLEQFLRGGRVGEELDGAGGHTELAADRPPAEPGCQ